MTMNLTNQSPFLVLYTKDVDRLVTYYTQLGVQIKEQADDRCVVEFGGFDLHYILHSTEPMSDYHYVSEMRDPGSGVLLYLESTNIEEDLAKIRGSGGKVVTEPADNAWDCQEALYEDPDGYKFVIWSDK